MADGALVLGEVVDAMAEASLIAGSIVGVVRNTVRDLLAEVVGTAISKALQALLVVAIPKVLAEVALLVAECTAKIAKVLERLNDAIRRWAANSPLLRRSRPASVVPWTKPSQNDVRIALPELHQVHQADHYLADSEGVSGAYKSAYRALEQPTRSSTARRPRLQSMLSQDESLQNGGATGDGLLNDEPHPPGDRPADVMRTINVR
ncbi:hypothetical protein [Actinoplanes friuliensis]|uniref:Uncharacterized protein n=1 Tax=Actinoplanes friuliensis DSM 7358 TaxID=1246995 RepID=U5VSH6_9ACTN|nr:hypothetical protein [Actinoplanes friuliensis]AGZ39948.1 hypothetical protein AFR_08295 [Actinoplanes friuliensis DSM 7358]